MPQKAPMPDLLDLADSIVIADGDTYILSYRHLVAHFQSKQIYTDTDFVCGAHMVYGWMPTILKLHPEPPGISFDTAAQLLTRAKSTRTLSRSEMDQLADIMNNSLVGLSKLLHFVAPDSFAIWDSRIYTYLHKKEPSHHQVRDLKAYDNYHTVLRSHKQDQRFERFHRTVNQKVGYDVSPFRALELVMFQNSAATGV